MATIECFFEDFEPFCKWERDEKFDILEIYVPEFKKEELKVRIISKDILVITGERDVNKSLRCRFRKEIKLCKNMKKDEVHAKLLKAGILYITLPKKKKHSESRCLPSTCLCNLERVNMKTKLGVEVGAILLAATFGALVYNHFFCAHIQS